MAKKKAEKSKTLEKIVAPPYDWENDPPSVKNIMRDSHGRLTKGHSGNLDGMPPGTVSLVRLLKARLKKHPEDQEKIIEALVKMGKVGDMRAIEHLFDRIDGKVVERHAIEGELPVRIVFVPAQLDKKEPKTEEAKSVDA